MTGKNDTGFNYLIFAWSEVFLSIDSDKIPYKNQYLIEREKVGIKFRMKKKLLVKNFVTGKIICYFLPTKFFACLSEKTNCIKKNIDLLPWSLIILLSLKNLNQI